MKIAISSSGLTHVHRGVENSSMNLAYALKEIGIDVTLFKGSGTKNSEAEIVLPCIKRNSCLSKKIMRTSPSFAWRIGLGSDYQLEQTSFSFSLLGCLKNKKYDILHTKDPNVADIVSIFNKLGIIKTKIIFANGTEEPLKFAKKFEYLQFLTPYHLQEAQKEGIDKTKSFAIPNFVDVEKFNPNIKSNFREELKIPQEAFVILAVSAVKNSHKRLNWLIKEVSLFTRYYTKDIYFIITGSVTKETKDIVCLGYELLGDKVKFLIDQPFDKMPEIYASANIFVLGSLFETFGTVLIEAMASGVPTICHRHPAMRWIIGEGGECIDMTKEGTLAKVLEKYLDKDYRVALGKKAREQAVNNFSKEKVVEQTIQMYKAVLSGK